MMNKYFFSLLVGAMAIFATRPACASDDFVLGADISGVSELESAGTRFLDEKGKQTDLYRLMGDYGIEAVRLRVWVDPAGGFCSPADVLSMALRAKEAGMPVMVDFHYSDWWADPGKQNIPERWKGMSSTEMKGALREHTASTLQMLRNAGIDVRWIQIGNETTHGMLWDTARSETQMPIYAELTRAGYDAAKSVYPDAQIIVHLDNGWDKQLYDNMFDALKRNGAKWDMIGMSLYPFWSMQAGQIKSEDELIERAVENIRELKKKFGTDVMIVEVGVEANEPKSGKQFLDRLLAAASTQTDGACRGVWYWAPEADGVLDGYKLGAFQNRRPTEIMHSFRDFARKQKK